MAITITGVGIGACIPRDGTGQDITIVGTEFAGLKPKILKSANCSTCSGNAGDGACEVDDDFEFLKDPDPGNITSTLYKTAIWLKRPNAAAKKYPLGMIKEGRCVACLKDAVSVCDF